MNPISFIDKNIFIPVDEWIPEEQDVIFRHTKGAMVLPVSKFYGMESGNLDYFILSTKRCYNNDDMRNHCAHYLNYFEKFYDLDKELLMIYYHLKYLIDFEQGYTKETFIYDLKKYILSPVMLLKLEYMNTDNYSLLLNYRNKDKPALQYTERHASILMKMSVLMNIMIPLLTHFIYIKKIENSNYFLLEVFDIILHMSNVDVYNKLYETSSSNINKTKDKHSVLWDMQDIRGKNTTTHSLSSVINIILNIIPKYTYDKNIICFNYRSIQNNTSYQILDIGYEFSYVSLSSSKRDEDNNSEFDKFESYLIKQDESLYLQNKVNCQETMKSITNLFGPFDQEEIDFYTENLQDENKSIINKFQEELIFNLFYKYFGDPQSIKAINSEDYVKLMISAKKILNSYNMVILPYIISGKIDRLIYRKSVNKRELTKIESSIFYKQIINKYKNDKIVKYILYLIATILSSEFKIIDFDEPTLHGKSTTIIPDIICEEMLMYAILI
jgi:hypothetical protein